MKEITVILILGIQFQSGTCLEPLYHTIGKQSEQCFPGYYRDDLVSPHADCKRCVCDPYGTEQSGEESDVCDNISGQCWCKPHVTGRNCDICEIDYYDITSGNGCRDCNCDQTGSLSSACHLETGQCQCKPGITGKRCDTCEPLHYGRSSSGCAACDCNYIGSQSLQCDAKGKCLCNPNVTGNVCSRCQENMYDIRHGCMECPQCYSNFRDAMEKYKNKFREIYQIISSITNNPIIEDNSDFDDTLTRVQNYLNIIFKHAKEDLSDANIPDHWAVLQERIERSQDIIMQMTESIMEGNNATFVANEFWNIPIDKTKKELEGTLMFMATEGLQALQLARNHSRESNRLEKADKAYKLAEEKVQTLQKILAKSVFPAVSAKNKTAKALAESENIIDVQNGFSEVTILLNAMLKSTESQLRATSALSTETFEHITKAEINAKSVLTTVDNCTTPLVNISDITEQARYVDREYYRIKREVEDISSAQKIINIKSHVNSSKVMSEETVRLQMDMNLAFKEAKAANSVATNALNLGNEILDEASSWHLKLLDFSSQSNAAADALKEKGIIEKDLEEAKSKAESADEKYYNLDIRMVKAKSEVNVSQNKTQFINKVAGEILDKVRQDKYVEFDFGDLHIHEHFIDKFESEYENEQNEIESTKNLLNLAKSNANEAMMQVKQLVNTFKSLSTNDHEIEEIISRQENNLKSAQNKVEVIEKIINRLQKDLSRQEKQIPSLDQKFKKLVSEVDVINAISSALPEECFKRANLEPKHN